VINDTLRVKKTTFTQKKAPCPRISLIFTIIFLIYYTNQTKYSVNIYVFRVILYNKWTNSCTSWFYRGLLGRNIYITILNLLRI